MHHYVCTCSIMWQLVLYVSRAVIFSNVFFFFLKQQYYPRTKYFSPSAKRGDLIIIARVYVISA